jgi:hypothetical protein
VQRLFADDYSSSGQVAWKEGRRGSDPDDWGDDLLGLLRFDALVAATLVIPDSHLFDGPFFLARSPKELAEALGQPGREQVGLPRPLEIRGRGEGLADTLATLLVREGSETLNAFVFKTIADEQLRSVLAEELGNTPRVVLERALSREDDVAAAVASVLRDAIHRVDPGVDGTHLVGPIEDGWRRWLAEERWVSVETWPIHRSFDIAKSLELDPPVSKRLKTQIGRDALREVLAVVARGSGHRADVSKVLAEPRATATTAGDEAALLDFDAIDNWYSRGRYRALAWRHGCSCALADPPGLPALSVAQYLLREIRRGDATSVSRVALPEAVLRRLADMESADYQHLVFAQRRELRRWWKDGETDGLKAVAGALGEFDPTTKRKRIGVAQLLPFVPPALGYGVGRALGDATAGATLGGEAGVAVSLAMVARRTNDEKVQSRIVEAFVDRTRDDGMDLSHR